MSKALELLLLIHELFLSSDWVCVGNHYPEHTSWCQIVHETFWGALEASWWHFKQQSYNYVPHFQSQYNPVSVVSEKNHSAFLFGSAIAASSWTQYSRIMCILSMLKPINPQHKEWRIRFAFLNEFTKLKCTTAYLLMNLLLFFKVD